MRHEAARGATGACAGAVLITTSVMAALEPCLPLWIMHKFHPEVPYLYSKYYCTAFTSYITSTSAIAYQRLCVQRWALGAVFLPDSVGYLLAASSLGAPARRAGPERVAVAAVLCVGLAALAVPHAPSVLITRNFEMHYTWCRCYVFYNFCKFIKAS